MVYLFLGQEHFLKNQTLLKLKNKACPGTSSNLNYEEFQSSEADLNEVLDWAKTSPFMARFRLLLIKDVNRLTPEEKEILVSFIENKPASVVLALMSDSLSTQDTLYKTVARRGRVMNFDPLEGIRLHKWISNRFSSFNKRVQPGVIELLVNNVGNNLMQLDRAIDLLVTFVGKADTIRLGDVEGMIGENLEATTYQLVDAVGSKNADLALRILQDLDKDASQIPQIIGFIGWHLRRIWRVKKLALQRLPLQRIAATVGIPQYARESFFKAVNNFSTQELEKGFKTLLKFDEDIKSKSLQPYRALELLIVQLCVNPAPARSGWVK